MSLHPLNMQTSWTIMRLKDLRLWTFVQWMQSFFFNFLLPLSHSVLHFTPASWKWQEGRQECKGEGRSKIGWLSCEMLILWTKTTTVEMRAEIQSVVLPAEDNNRDEKQERSSKEVAGGQSSICFARKKEWERHHGPGQHALGAHYYWDKITKQLKYICVQVVFILMAY